ncbi:MAG: holo-ACP synthase [Syntrophomonadaceae bacterium]
MLAGVDIIEIERFRQTVERTPRILGRVFTQAELDYCYRFNNPYPSLAARFAAKEAVKKLHSGFMQGVRFQDIEVLNDPDGRPRVHLYGRAAEFHCESGISSIGLSLSHSLQQAVAMAVAREGE